jgi:tripartite-type tricarboxylate transporter receptor subunit TctC
MPDVAKLKKKAAELELKKQFDSQDAVPSPMTPGEFASFVKTEQTKWGPVVVATGAKLE